MRALLSGYRVSKLDGGPECEALERELESYYHVKHARVVNSATSALHTALVAIGVGPGDEVLVPAYSMSASATAVLHAGATPVFCDIGDDYCLDWSDALARSTERTRAVVLVHLFGHHATVPAAVPFPIVHDCAQSPGLVPARRVEGKTATVSWPILDATGNVRGDVGAFDCWVHSFNQHKIVSGGEGGAILTNCGPVAARMHAVRNHGECYTDDIVGYNYRMTEPIAKIIRANFADLDKRLSDRRKWSFRMRDRYDLPCDMGNEDWFLYPVRTKGDRERYAARVGGRVGYHKPIPSLPYYAKRGYVTPPHTALIESELVVVDPLTDES